MPTATNSSVAEARDKAGNAEAAERRAESEKIEAGRSEQDEDESIGRDRRLSIAPPEYCPEETAPAPRRAPHALNQTLRSHLARMTLSITPAGMAANMFAWMAHMALSPGKQYELFERAQMRNARFLSYAAEAAFGARPDKCARPLTDEDERFEGEDWQKWPFNVIHQAFLLTQEFWFDATNNVDGLPRAEEKALSFVTRQFLDRFSPTNFVATNPEVARATMKEGGANLWRGFHNALEDWRRLANNQAPAGTEKFKLGEDLATTEGKVVYRNHLIELIQYTPKTEQVYAEPVLITPAWIMKYYILDLSPHNSLVRFLVERGYTVFIISWRNPTAEDRDFGMNDYIKHGFMDALDAVNAIVPDVKIHAVGYCIGGTLLTMAAAAMARDGDDRIKTVSLFAAQTDFTEAGEIMLFVSESQVSYLESLMWDQGYLGARQMAGAFQMLQSNDLIWSRYVHEYLLGNRQDMFDLMAWNADATRLPFKMHSEYLRKLFLENALTQRKFEVEGAPISISDIKQPIFCVSTEKDHVAPWRSVYKIHLLTDTDITFVLANRGHNGGIVSEPGHKGRKYKLRTRKEDDKYIPPDEWRATADEWEGSWWLAMDEWLAERSSGMRAPPKMGGGAKAHQPIADAPGFYVFQK